MSSAEPESLRAPAPVDADEEEAPSAAQPFAWRKNLLLFGLTVLSVFSTATLADEAMTPVAPGHGAAAFIAAAMKNGTAIAHGAQFTAALLTILLAHEFGHYIAARIHKVDTSLPFFIPVPILSPFGTMGAIIRMRGRIPTRRALLDIGASGPLAGLSLAIPLYYWGASHSQVVPIPPGAVELGDSLLLKFLDHLAAPNVPEGKTLLLSPVAYAAWGGMFVTMINLLPVGQLDGGHVAYALFGKLQNTFARNVHRLIFVFFVGILSLRIGHDVLGGLGFSMMRERIQMSMFWFMWFQVLSVLGTVSSKNAPAPASNGPGGPLRVGTRIFMAIVLTVLPASAEGAHAWMVWILLASAFIAYLVIERTRGVFREHALFDHPPAGDQRLGLGRSIIAVVTLLFFILLFMPTPFAV